MNKSSKTKRNNLIRVLGADTISDSIRPLDEEALKRVTGGISITTTVSKSTPKL